MERGTPKIRTPAQLAVSRLLADNWGRIRASLEKQHGGPMTVRELAQAVGIPKSSVGNLESGMFGTQIDTLVPIAECLGLQVWMLLVENFDPEHPPAIAVKVGARQSAATTRERAITP